METNRFDALSKALAGRASRRRAVGRLAGGGVGAALLAAVGLGRTAVATQDAATPVATSVAGTATRCLLPFEATVRRGPSAGLALTGTLSLAIDARGTAWGILALPDGAGDLVVGQGDGRAVNLLVTLADGRVVYGVGVAEHDVRDCTGAMGGPLVGPQPGDAGDWSTTGNPFYPTVAACYSSCTNVCRGYVAEDACYYGCISASCHYKGPIPSYPVPVA